MAFLILTRSGLDALKAQCGQLPKNLWVNSDILTEAEAQIYRAKGLNLTTLSHTIASVDHAAIRAALDAIAEHHPNEPVYSEWPDC